MLTPEIEPDRLVDNTCDDPAVHTEHTDLVYDGKYMYHAWCPGVDA